MNLDQVTNVQVAGIDMRDYPYLCDSFIESATYCGKPMTDEQLDELNDDSDYVHECVMNHLF